MTQQRRFLSSSITLLVVIVVSFVFYFFYYSEHSIPLNLVEDKMMDHSTISLQGPTKKVALFFVNSDGTSLVTVEKEIPADITLIEQIKTTIQALLDEPPPGFITSLPERTKLQSLFIDTKGNSYLDFSREIQQNHIGGLTAELLTIGSIVNTLLFNFKELKGVQILVEGSEIETLAGHIDCTKPFSRLLMVENK